MKVKLLDRSLINRYGAVIVEVQRHVRDKLVDRGMAVDVTPSTSLPKSVNTPPSHKAIFVPPEEKMMRDVAEDMTALPNINGRYPGNSDPLFPEELIGV